MRRKLTLEEYDTLESHLSGFGTIQNYSGRAMYGGLCLGIKTRNDVKTMFNLGYSLRDAEDSSKEASNLIEILTETNHKTDNLGTEYGIVYFPDVQLPDEIADIEED